MNKINYLSELVELKKIIIELIRLFLFSYLIYLSILIYNIDIDFKIVCASYIISSIIAYFFSLSRIRLIWILLLNIIYIFLLI